jgi:hypothetical protein
MDINANKDDMMHKIIIGLLVFAIILVLVNIFQGSKGSESFSDDDWSGMDVRPTVAKTQERYGDIDNERFGTEGDNERFRHYGEPDLNERYGDIDNERYGDEFNERFGTEGDNERERFQTAPGSNQNAMSTGESPAQAGLAAQPIPGTNYFNLATPYETNTYLPDQKVGSGFEPTDLLSVEGTFPLNDISDWVNMEGNTVSGSDFDDAYDEDATLNPDNSLQASALVTSHIRKRLI